MLQSPDTLWPKAGIDSRRFIVHVVPLYVTGCESRGSHPERRLPKGWPTKRATIRELCSRVLEIQPQRELNLPVGSSSDACAQRLIEFAKGPSIASGGRCERLPRLHSRAE